MPTDDERFGWYRALQRGTVLKEGPTPIPDDIRLEATEIHWFDAEPVEVADRDPAAKQPPISLVSDGDPGDDLIGFTPTPEEESGYTNPGPGSATH